MAHKCELGWRRETEEGERLDVFARKVGREWIFYHRGRRFDQWQLETTPPWEDWLELHDAVKRRVERRLLQPDDLARVVQRMHERFPGKTMPDSKW